MFANTEGLVILLLYSLAVGVALGILYDAIMLVIDTAFPVSIAPVTHEKLLGATEREASRTLFAIDKRIRARDVALFFSDIAFFLISAVAVIILLYHLNYGSVRVLSLVSVLVGYTVYRKTVGRPVLRFAKFILKKLAKILKKTLAVLLKPFISAFEGLIMPKIETVRLKGIRKKSRKYLLAMEKADAKRRKNKNERNKGVSING